MHTRKKYSTLAATLVAAALAVGALSACTAPAPADGGANPAPDGGAPTFESFEDYQLAFADCLRGEGIDMADPTSDGGQSLTQNDEALAQAIETCQDELGRPPGQSGEGVGDSAAVREEHLRIAACLRDLGVDVPDPAPGEDLAIPSEVPLDAFETCAPSGVGGSTGGD